jgi:hypothetical protein
MRNGPGVSRVAAAWFTVWQWLFGLAVAASLVTTTLGFVLQIRVIGAITLLLALLGTIVCQLGLANVRGRAAHATASAPAHGLRAHLSAVHGAGLAHAGGYRAPVDPARAPWHSHPA